MKSKYVLYCQFVVSILLVHFSSSNAFFWDAISQVSVPANWYYTNGLHHFFLPDAIATGHPPIVGMYIAIAWKIFGRSLQVAHWAMLPFIVITVWSLWHWIYFWIKDSAHTAIITSIILADATLLSQHSMVTFDVVQISMLVLSLYAITAEKKWLLSLSLVVLFLCSLRGAMSGIGLLVYYLIFPKLNGKQIQFKNIVPFLPAICILFLFLLIFRIEKGWVIHNTVSNKWQNAASFANSREMVRNCIIFAWRLVDFGRIGYAIGWIMAVIWLWRNPKNLSLPILHWIVFFLCEALIFFPFLIVYQNAFGHRYLLPLIIPMIATSVYFFLLICKNSFGKVALTVSCALAISGYFWIYPIKIAQGWDATPAHWPYFTLRQQMLAHLDQKSIPIEQVGSSFPNNYSLSITDINLNKHCFAELNLQENSYVLFSNVFNLNDEAINTLQDKQLWEPVFKVENKGVFLCLYQRKSN